MGGEIEGIETKKSNLTHKSYHQSDFQHNFGLENRKSEKCKKKAAQCVAGMFPSLPQ